MARATMTTALSAIALILTACATEPAAGPEAEAPTLAAAVPATPGQPVIFEPDAGDVVWFFQESPERLGAGGELRIYMDHVTHREARGSFAKFTLGVGGALPIHRHDKTEEIAYIISGEGEAVGVDTAGAEVSTRIAEGYVWYNPPGVWHAVRNTGAVPLSMVFVTIPNEEKGLLAFFRQIGSAPGTAARAIPAEELARMSEDHDVIFRPPVAEGDSPE